MILAHLKLSLRTALAMAKIETLEDSLPTVRVEVIVSMPGGLDVDKSLLGSLLSEVGIIEFHKFIAYK